MVLLNLCTRVLTTYYHIRINEKYTTAMLSTNMTENNESRELIKIQWTSGKFSIPSLILHKTTRATINDENVMTIVPWFHEFSMESHLAQCDQFLYEKAVSMSNINKVDHGHWKETVLTSFWGVDQTYNQSKQRERKETFQHIIKVHEFSCIYDLQKTKDETENIIQTLLNYGLVKTSHLFDISAVKVLTNLFLPLAQEEDDGYKYFVSEGKSRALWSWLGNVEFEQTQLEGLSLEEVNSSPLLPRLIKNHIDLLAEEEERHDIQCSARELVQDLLDNAPNELYNNMSHASDRKTAGRMCLMGILKEASTTHKEVFRKLRVTLPETYNQV